MSKALTLREGIVFFGALLVVLSLYFIQLNGPDWGSYWLIPDGVSWGGFVVEFLEMGWSFFEAAVGSANLLLVVFYAIPVWLGFWAVFLVNLLIYFAAISLSARDSGKLAILFFAMPYFWLALALPSKDVLTLMLTYLFWEFAGREKAFVSAFLIAAMAVLVRDGYGLLLIVYLCCQRLASILRVSDRHIVLMSLAGVFIYICCADQLLSGYFFYDRNVSVAATSSSYDFTTENSLQGYLLRIFGNVTNLAFRSHVFDSGDGVDILGIAYWMSGATVLVLIMDAARAFMIGREEEAKAGTFIIFMVVMVSLSPMIQPRYLFPLLTIWPILLKRQSLYGYLVVIPLSIGMHFVYGEIGLEKPYSDPDSVRLLELMNGAY